ncbi:MAG: hypothetical protein H0X65_14650 [Gemmatimonadetes bacterium]|nr:hypothetical protein [Gemmatimonadota bacterium]
MVMILMIMAIIFVLSPVAQAYAKRLNQPGLPPGASPAELARLREEVDQLSAQVNRLQDEQAFMVRLLSEGDGARASGVRRDAELQRPAPRPGRPRDGSDDESR